MNKKDFESLKKSMNQAIEYNKGDKTKARNRVIEIADLPELSREDIKRIRKKLNFSQSLLAHVLGVSNKTVEAWEAGKNSPSGPSARLLSLFDSDDTAQILSEKFIKII